MTATRKPTSQRLRFDSLEQEAYLTLWRTYDRLKVYEEELFAQWDLTAQQYNVLRLLRAEHPTPVPTLSLVSKLISRAPDVTRMLDKLEHRQLITRTKSQSDRRSVMINITSTGMQLLESIHEPLSACHEKQMGHLSDTQLKNLVQLLHLVRQPHETTQGPWNTSHRSST